MRGTVVLGLGNLVHADDGVGVHALQALMRDRRVPSEVALLDGGTQGLALLPHVCNVGRLLVLDAVDAGQPPGSVMRFEGSALQGIPGKASVHQLGFADLMIAMKLMDASPSELLVLGVQPESTDWGVELTPAVAAGMSRLVECAVDQLQVWQGLQS